MRALVAPKARVTGPCANIWQCFYSHFHMIKSLSISIFLNLYLSQSLSFSISISLNLYLSQSLSLSISIFLNLYLSLSFFSLLNSRSIQYWKKMSKFFIDLLSVVHNFRPRISTCFILTQCYQLSKGTFINDLTQL